MKVYWLSPSPHRRPPLNHGSNAVAVTHGMGGHRQGLTLPRIQLGLGVKESSSGLTFVALSRVTSLSRSWTGEGKEVGREILQATIRGLLQALTASMSTTFCTYLSRGYYSLAQVVPAWPWSSLMHSCLTSSPLHSSFFAWATRTAPGTVAVSVLGA